MTNEPSDISVERGGGRSLAVRLAGAATGPLVIYMHGSPSSRLDVDYLHERSARRGVRLAGIDRPGYGRSTPERFDFQSVAADAVAVATHLGAPTFAAFGQSSGVGYALAIAATFPDRVTAVQPGGGGRPFEPGMTAWDALSDGEREGIQLVMPTTWRPNGCSPRPTGRPSTCCNSTTTESWRRGLGWADPQTNELSMTASAA